MADEVLTTATASNIQSIVNSLLARSATLDPVLLSILQEITDELDRLGIVVYDAPTSTGKPSDSTGTSGKPLIPTSFTYTLTQDNVLLFWTPADSNYVFYEVRKGPTWIDGEKLFVTNNAQAILDPLKYGTHTFWLRTLSTLGEYSNDILSVTITIPEIGFVVVTSAVVANSVTLGWTIPSSTWRLDYYKVKRDGVQIATTAGTFFAISEDTAGEHTFGIIPVDIAGNEGPESQITVITTGVTDYQFFAKLNSSLNGTKVNGKVSNGRLYITVNNTETIKQHFDSRGWISPKAQIDAGYPYWLSPSPLTGSYEEVFDFGSIITNVVVTVNWLYEILRGSFTFGWDIRISLDGINYDTPRNVPSFYVTSVRYVKVKINFTASDDKALMAFYGLSVALNVKRENDGGFGTAIASDTLGTAVSFTKTFVDIDSITVTPVSDTSTFATYEFIDVPFPTTFTVKIFDNAGVRITRDFKWAARGVV